MIYDWLADLTLLVHLGFIGFVAAGGLLVLRWRRLAWLHLPAAIWGVAIEVGGWICPLTPLENHWRRKAGQAGYEGGFIEHYLTAAIYPEGLTRTAQWLIALGVLAINLAVYAVVWRRRAARTGSA
ncbi:MAG: DUF2784 domain-containing protein [Gemmatimonadetes bacterium]|nr:DUF2784 domain-containing protein [Gemmatimonadota bacterium]